MKSQYCHMFNLHFAYLLVNTLNADVIHDFNTKVPWGDIVNGTFLGLKDNLKYENGKWVDEIAAARFKIQMLQFIMWAITKYASSINVSKTSIFTFPCIADMMTRISKITKANPALFNNPTTGGSQAGRYHRFQNRSYKILMVRGKACITTKKYGIITLLRASKLSTPVLARTTKLKF